MINILTVSRTQEVLKINFSKLNLASNDFLQILTVFGTCIWTAHYSMGILKTSDKKACYAKNKAFY